MGDDDGELRMEKNFDEVGFVGVGGRRKDRAGQTWGSERLGRVRASVRVELGEGWGKRV